MGYVRFVTFQLILVQFCFQVHEFQISPDGKYIAFSSADESTPEQEKKDNEKDDPTVWGDTRCKDIQYYPENYYDFWQSTQGYVYTLSVLERFGHSSKKIISFSSLGVRTRK